MQWGLFLFTLTVQCSLCSCRLYEYHLIEEKKTWEQAQEFCRDRYSDLATVTDMADTEELKRTMVNKNVTEAWIGLRSNPGKPNRAWHWSLPGVEFGAINWENGEPNDSGGKENCAPMKEGNDKWIDDNCGDRHGFICYNDTDQLFHVEDSKTSWTQAQKFCREHHTDLISGLDQLKNFSETNSDNQSRYLWIGLFRDTWNWSDGSNFSFRNWESDEFQVGDDKDECAAASASSGNWSPDNCSQEKSFFCYDDKVILVRRNMTWVDALYYCRDNYHDNDLVAIRDAAEQRWVQAKAKNATTPHVWLGMRYTCTLGFWFWVSDEVAEYENWDPMPKDDVCSMSGAMSKDGAHKWFKMLGNRKFNFICSKV